MIWLRMERFVLIARSASDGKSGGGGLKEGTTEGEPNNGFVRVLCCVEPLAVGAPWNLDALG